MAKKYYNGQNLDMIKERVQKQLFQKGLCEIMSKEARFCPVTESTEEGRLGLDKRRDIPLKSPPMNLEVRGGNLTAKVINTSKILSYAEHLGANAYMMGSISPALGGDRPDIINYIPISFYKSSRIKRKN